MSRTRSAPAASATAVARASTATSVIAARRVVAATLAAHATLPAPPGYVWEATDEQISERFGVPVATILRFDLNTSPQPPDLAVRILRAGAYGRPISEYPPSDYRDLVSAAAEAYGVARDELLVGAGADEVLDLVAKAFLSPGSGAVIPAPTYAMYRVLTEQRPARPIVVPRRSAAEGYALDGPAVRGAARAADLVWLCSPNNPTGLPEPAGSIAALLAAILADAGDDGREAPVVVLDEAYAEFVDASLVGLRATYPRLITVRTASKAYGLAGLRVGFAIARRDVVAAMDPYRPPGSVSIPSVAVVAAALRAPDVLRETVARVTAERDRLRAALLALGLLVGPTSTNFLLIDLGDQARAEAIADGLLRRGLVPRTFGPGHRLSDHLRLTVRTPGDDDRLVAALAEILPALPPPDQPPSGRAPTEEPLP